MHYLYILYSKKLDRYYIGQTIDIQYRLKKHNDGHFSATKGGTPWQLKRVIEFQTKSEAIKAENWLKKMKSRRIIEAVFTGDKSTVR